jgi:hypothetical protein
MIPQDQGGGEGAILMRISKFLYPPSIARCQHVKVNGVQCGSPALKNRKLCHFHQRWQQGRIQLNANQARRSRYSLDLPILEDANSIQVALMQGMRLLLTNQVDHRTAALLFYALQTASSNLSRTTFEPRPQQVVIDPSSIADTSLGDDAWYKEEFISDEDEQEEAETNDEPIEDAPETIDIHAMADSAGDRIQRHGDLVLRGGTLDFYFRTGHTFREVCPDEARGNDGHAHLIAAGSQLRLKQAPLLDERCSYSFEQKPTTQCYFENADRRIEPPQVHYLGEVGENDENEGTRRAPSRRDHTEGSQCARNIIRPKPQVAADGGCQSPKQQANVVLVETRAEVEPRQSLLSLCFKYSQVISATQESQSVKKIERHTNPHQGVYQPPECGQQCKAPIDWLENHIKRRENYYNAGGVN